MQVILNGGTTFSAFLSLSFFIFFFWLHWVFIVFVWAFSICRERVLLFFGVHRLLIAPITLWLQSTGSRHARGLKVAPLGP